MCALASPPIRTLTSPDGKIRFHQDIEGEDCYLDADFDYDSTVMVDMLAQVTDLGYEVMSYDECEHEVLFGADHSEDNYDGFVRAHAVLKA